MGEILSDGRLSNFLPKESNDVSYMPMGLGLWFKLDEMTD